MFKLRRRVISVMSQSHISHTYNIDGGKEAKIRKKKV